MQSHCLSGTLKNCEPNSSLITKKISQILHSLNRSMKKQPLGHLCSPSCRLGLQVKKQAVLGWT